MEKKKVTVSTVSTRKFVESLLYLGSVGGEVTDQCVTIKGMFLRAEVLVDVDTPIKETQEMKVSPGMPVEVEVTVEDKPTPKAKKTARKTAVNKEDTVEPSQAPEEDNKEEQ